MISFVWRLLPGPRWVRFLAMVAMGAAIAAALWYGIYPRLPDLVPLDEPTVE
ncbi:hypothetical protein [Amycolatopsis suaedae]|uniref:hypothetical protein n=1 Tax=Amycolatopsis suaedae TaxID=2510978 RepID=UPI0013EEFBC3|nr:hypothetical protein [Amycolatopsis suaedae]